MRQPTIAIVDYTTGQQLDTGIPERFQETITEFLGREQTGADTLQVGDVQLLGLAEVRDFVGDAWNKVKSDVYQLVEAVLNQETGPGDVYFRTEDERYVVMFKDLTPALSDKKARDIGQKVMERLGGTHAPGGGMITARCRVVAVDPAPVQSAGSAAAILAAVTEAIDSAEAGQRKAFESRKSLFKALYWPMTNIPKGLISFYRTEITSENKEQKADRALVSDFDIFGLEKLSVDMAKAKGPKQRALSLLTVHYETLADRGTRTRFIEFARDIEARVRHRLAIEIADAPPEVSQARLNQIFGEMSPYFIGFVCRFPMDFRGMSRLDGLKLLGISVDGAVMGKDRPRKSQFKELKRFAEQVKGRNVRTFMTGVLSVEIARAARRAEFDYVDGPGVLQPLPLPGRVYTVR